MAVENYRAVPILANGNSRHLFPNGEDED